MKKKNQKVSLSEKPKFEKVKPFLKKPIEITDRFIADHERLDENILIIKKNR